MNVLVGLIWLVIWSFSVCFISEMKVSHLHKCVENDFIINNDILLILKIFYSLVLRWNSFLCVCIQIWRVYNSPMVFLRGYHIPFTLICISSCIISLCIIYSCFLFPRYMYSIIVFYETHDLYFSCFPRYFHYVRYEISIDGIPKAPFSMYMIEYMYIPLGWISEFYPHL